MEEKKLDAQESIELITRMIRNTRQRLERHSGRPFLIWGYTTVAVSLLNYSLNIAGADPAWSLSWFLIPVLGILLMRLFPEKKSSEPRTEIDRIVNSLWIVCSLALVPIFILCLFHGFRRRARAAATRRFLLLAQSKQCHILFLLTQTKTAMR